MIDIKSQEKSRRSDFSIGRAASDIKLCLTGDSAAATNAYAQTQGMDRRDDRQDTLTTA